MWQGGGYGRPVGDVQTDVHIVPVDSDSPIRNLLKVQTVRCALALYRRNYIPSPAPNLLQMDMHPTDCKKLMCLQVVSDVIQFYKKCPLDHYI